jgi:hypothetical protein
MLSSSQDVCEDRHKCWGVPRFSDGVRDSLSQGGAPALHGLLATCADLATELHNKRFGQLTFAPAASCGPIAPMRPDQNPGVVWWRVQE